MIDVLYYDWMNIFIRIMSKNELIFTHTLTAASQPAAPFYSNNSITM